MIVWYEKIILKATNIMEQLTQEQELTLLEKNEMIYTLINALFQLSCLFCQNGIRINPNLGSKNIEIVKMLNRAIEDISDAKLCREADRNEVTYESYLSSTNHSINLAYTNIVNALTK